MKIAFFVHCFFPDHFYGTEKYTLDLARHYRAKGHEVVVVTALFQGEQPAKDLVSYYEFQGIPVFCIDKNKIPHCNVKGTYYQSEMVLVLEGVLRKLSPDVVHVTHLINHTAALLEATKNLNIPTYSTFTDFFGFCLNNKLEGANGNLCTGPSASRTNCLTCYIKESSRNPVAASWMQAGSSPLKARLIAEAINLGRHLPGLSGGRIDGLVEDIVQRPGMLSSLYNTAYVAAVAPTSFLRSAYEQNGINIPLHSIWFGVDIDRSPKPDRSKDHIPVIGFIGQIAPHKGTDLLIEAFKRLPRNSAELRIYGPADQDAAYMAKLKVNSAGYDVQFLDTFPSEQMATVLSGIDLLVIPSRWYENSPLVLLNALATHTPVLVSDVPGMTEFLQPAINGYSFVRGCARSLEEKLLALLSDRAALFAMSKTTNYERTSYDMAKQTLSIYQ